MFILSFIFLIVTGLAYAYWASHLVPKKMRSGMLVAVILGLIAGCMVCYLRPNLVGCCLIVCMLVSAVFILVPSLMSRRDNSRSVWD